MNFTSTHLTARNKNNNGTGIFEREDQHNDSGKVIFSKRSSYNIAFGEGRSTLGSRGFVIPGLRFRSSLKKWHAGKASGPERHSFDSAEPITTQRTPKHPESGCFADWFFGDIECFKCSDWITITIGACLSGRRRVGLWPTKLLVAREKNFWYPG